jgi:hypothetical protein
MRSLGLLSIRLITSNDILKQNLNLIVPVPLNFAPEAVTKKRIKIGLKLPFLMAFTGIFSDSQSSK